MEEVECAKCECCGLPEDCTRDYIVGVRAAFGGRWLCGLCSEAVRDEAARGTTKQRGGGAGGAAAAGMEEALRDHMVFCGKCRRSPAFRVADGMRQMLRRRSKRSKLVHGIAHRMSAWLALQQSIALE